jgi:hypothetical protein
LEVCLEIGPKVKQGRTPARGRGEKDGERLQHLREEKKIGQKDCLLLNKTSRTLLFAFQHKILELTEIPE